MKPKLLVMIGIAVLILTLAIIPVMAQQGPRADIEIYFYETDEAAWAAFKAGEVDYFGAMDYDQYMEAIADPSITVTPFVTTFTIDNWAYNSHYTGDPANPNHDFFGQQPETAPWKYIRIPTSDVYFRKAMACCVNYDRWLEEVFKGFGKKLDVPVAYASQDPWANETLVDRLGGTYPYRYNLTKAREYLEMGGWTDWDGDGIVNFPLDWPGVEGEIGVRDEPNINYPGKIPLYVYDTPEEERLCAYIWEEDMETVLGGDVIEVIPKSFSHFDEYIWTYYDFMMASDGWGVGRFPTYLYAFFHSENYYPGYGGLNAYWPGAPDLDEALEKFYFPENMSEAIYWAKRAQSLIVDKYCIWPTAGRSTAVPYAYRNLIGVVSTPYIGPWNFYTLMQARRVDDPDAPIRFALAPTPPNVNQITAMWSVSYIVMSQCWDDNFLVNPNTPSDMDKDFPLWTRDWYVPPLTWVDPDTGEEKTMQHYWLNHKFSWVEPVTGNVLDSFTSADIEFTTWYFYHTADPPAWWRYVFTRVDHVRPLGPYEVEFYFTRKSFWWYAYPWVISTIYRNGWISYWDPAKPHALIYDGDPTVDGKQPTVVTLVEGVNITTPGPAEALPHQDLNAPVDVLSVEADGTPLTEYTDFEIRQGYVWIYQNFTDGTEITITYWGRGEYVGYTVADIPLTEILYGTGPFYLVSFDPTTGAAYKRNENYALETPPWGEVDWWWRWEGTTKPRGGYMKIDIYDVVGILTAYGGSGTGAPSPNWVSSADVAEPQGVINIYDVVSATGKYGMTFWHLPEWPPP